MQDNITGRVAARVREYQEGGVVELRGGHKVRVEDRITLRGKPGFIGEDLDSGETVRATDDEIVRVSGKSVFDLGNKYERPFKGPGPELPGLARVYMLNRGPDGVVPSEEIHKYLRTVVKRGQKVHEVVRKAIAQYEKTFDASGSVRYSEVMQAVLILAKEEFGDDPLVRLIAREIATGEHLF